ncbi:MAG: radical SAM protein, partial [bacterium]
MKLPKTLISDNKGRIIDLPYFQPAAMIANRYVPIRQSDIIPLPFSSRILFLPRCSPVVLDPGNGRFIELDKNPYSGKPCCAVSAFIVPGYTITHNAGFRSGIKAGQLPLYAYAPALWFKEKFYTAAVRVDRDRRQDPRLINDKSLKQNINNLQIMFNKNRLVKHLCRCASLYCCPAAQNFFLERYECPLPVARLCNANCLGCISLQPSGCCPATQ